MCGKIISLSNRRGKRGYTLHFENKTRALWRIINRENGKWVSFNKKREIN
jgi:hypothetical protein